jgi:hypothetical protein
MLKIPEERLCFMKAKMIALAISMFAAGSLMAEDANFSLAIAVGDKLAIFGANGTKVAELPAPTLGQVVKASPVSFQVSFGRDASDRLTAIISPDPAKPSSLNFITGGRTVQMDAESVVTLIYSPDGRSVMVDPGLIGKVLVDRKPAVQTAVYQATVPMPAMAVANAPISDDLPPSVRAASQPTWIEPVTPPAPAKLPSITATEIKLVEVKGKVSVAAADGRSFEPAREGMSVPSGSIVKTSNGSSAAVLLGGVNSVRVAPDSQAQVVQKVDNGKRDTLVDLKRGTVFSKVGRRAGEVQTFQVKTPLGVAAAKGTDFAVKLASGNMIVFTSAGTVELRDANGNLIATLSSAPGLPIAIGSVMALTDAQKQELLNDLYLLIDSLNSKVNALRDKVAGGGTLTPGERAWLAQLGVALDVVNPPSNPPGDLPPPTFNTFDPNFNPTPGETPPGEEKPLVSDYSRIPTPEEIALDLFNFRREVLEPLEVQLQPHATTPF